MTRLKGLFVFCGLLVSYGQLWAAATECKRSALRDSVAEHASVAAHYYETKSASVDLGKNPELREYKAPTAKELAERSDKIDTLVVGGIRRIKDKAGRERYWTLSGENALTVGIDTSYNIDFKQDVFLPANLKPEERATKLRELQPLFEVFGSDGVRKGQINKLVYEHLGHANLTKTMAGWVDERPLKELVGILPVGGTVEYISFWTNLWNGFATNMLTYTNGTPDVRGLLSELDVHHTNTYYRDGQKEQGVVGIFEGLDLEIVKNTQTTHEFVLDREKFSVFYETSKLIAYFEKDLGLKNVRISFIKHPSTTVSIDDVLHLQHWDRLGLYSFRIVGTK